MPGSTPLLNPMFLGGREVDKLILLGREKERRNGRRSYQEESLVETD